MPRKTSKRDPTDVLQTKAEEFLREHSEIQEALKTFGIAEQQYASAVAAIRRRDVRVVHSTNEQ